MRTITRLKPTLSSINERLKGPKHLLTIYLKNGRKIAVTAYELAGINLFLNGNERVGLSEIRMLDYQYPN